MKNKKQKDKKLKDEKRTLILYPIIVMVIGGVIYTFISNVINPTNVEKAYRSLKQEIISNAIIIGHNSILEAAPSTFVDQNLISQSLEVKEVFISPLYTYERIESSDDVSDYRNWLSSDGCVLNTFVSNTTNRNVAISEYKLVIEKVEPIEIPCANIFALCSDNVLSLYVVNYGNTELVNAKAQFLGYCNYFSSETTKIEQEQLAAILNIQNEDCVIDIPITEAGQILKFASLDLNKEAFNHWAFTSGENDMSLNVNLYFGGKQKIEIDNNFLGYFGNEGRNGDFGLTWAMGGVLNPIIRDVVVELTEETPFDIYLQTEFNIKANNTELLQVTILPKNTCEITFHLEMKEAGGIPIKTDSISQKVLVPLYDIIGGLANIRLWVIDNNITNYSYNDDPSLQEFINHKFGEYYY